MMNTVLLITTCVLIRTYTCDGELYAQGNLEVTFNAKSAKSSIDHSQRAAVPDLWCEAKEGDDLLLIREAIFRRKSNGKIIQANVTKELRAYMTLGLIPITDVGRYRCEIVTESGHRVWGWSFINSRPVFHDNRRYFETTDDDRFHIRAHPIKATEGENVVINCPVIGYPKPSIEWLKDDAPVAQKETITFLSNQLEISRVEFDDEGVYSCIARNAFNSYNGSKLEKSSYVSRLDCELRILSSYRWIYPLIVIAVILLFLFIIIYSRSMAGRYKTYNVEKREKIRIAPDSVKTFDKAPLKYSMLNHDGNDLCNA